MKQKLLNALDICKSLALKLYNLAPFGSGVLVGYIFKAELKLIVDAGILLVKGLLKI